MRVHGINLSKETLKSHRCDSALPTLSAPCTYRLGMQRCSALHIALLVILQVKAAFNEQGWTNVKPHVGACSPAQVRAWTSPATQDSARMPAVRH